MRPLARVHAYTDATLLAHPDLGVRAAAIAAAGAAVALLARAPGQTASFLTAAARRLVSLARPAEAAVLVSGRSDIAAGVGAHGVQLTRDDLTPSDARRVLGQGWIGCSVHSGDSARIAVREGADFLVVGSVYPTESHPGHPGAGLDLVRETADAGVPVIAIGGITPDRAWEVQAAGAYGVAAIRALWHAADPAAAALALLRPWMEDR
jgi:thiamine-phosphate pyrophosphorylase